MTELFKFISFIASCLLLVFIVTYFLETNQNNKESLDKDQKKYSASPSHLSEKSVNKMVFSHKTLKKVNKSPRENQVEIFETDEGIIFYIKK